MSTHSPLSTESTRSARSTEDQIRHSVQDLVDNNPEQFQEDAFIRLSKLQIEQAAVIGRVGINYDENNDVHLGGVVKFPSEDGRFVDEQLMLVTPYKSKDAIKETWDLGCYPKYNGKRWNIDPSEADTFVTHMIKSGFPVTGPIQLIAESLEVTPTQDQSSAARATGGGGATTPDVEATSCPVDGCGFECSDFKELRGHIGGKVAGKDESHTGLNLRIQDYR